MVQTNIELKGLKSSISNKMNKLNETILYIKNRQYKNTLM